MLYVQHIITSSGPSSASHSNIMDNPYISVRKYIKWGDEPKGEDTKFDIQFFYTISAFYTLVLTSRSKHYIDIRILLSPSSLPNDPLDTSPSTISRLQWAFAGTCHTTPANTKLKTPTPAHTIWTHWLDSNSSPDSSNEIKDEGDMYPQSDGSVLEYGSMMNAEKGKVMKYEECWEDVEPVLVGEEEVFGSWVLICGDEGKGRRGMLIRVGGVIQGLVRDDGGSRVVRWEWKEGEEEEGWEWVRTLAIGRLEVPGCLFEEGKRAEKGDELMGSDGLDWVCVESFEWS